MKQIDIWYQPHVMYTTTFCEQYYKAALDQIPTAFNILIIRQLQASI